MFVLVAKVKCGIEFNRGILYTGPHFICSWGAPFSAPYPSQCRAFAELVAVKDTILSYSDIPL